MTTSCLKKFWSARGTTVKECVSSVYIVISLINIVTVTWGKVWIKTVAQLTLSLNCHSYEHCHCDL